VGLDKVELRSHSNQIPTLHNTTAQTRNTISRSKEFVNVLGYLGLSSLILNNSIFFKRPHLIYVFRKLMKFMCGL
jgi:hypothetical protein